MVGALNSRMLLLHVLHLSIPLLLDLILFDEAYRHAVGTGTPALRLDADEGPRENKEYGDGEEYELKEAEAASFFFILTQDELETDQEPQDYHDAVVDNHKARHGHYVLHRSQGELGLKLVKEVGRERQERHR